MRYGAIPIVRATGGLVNTVCNAPRRSTIPHEGTGMVFHQSTPPSLTRALRRAFSLTGDPALLRELIQWNMKKDFSWERSAQHYRKLYQNLI